MKRIGVCLSAMAVVSALVTATPAAAASAPFTSSVFLATHNSYSGNLDNGQRMSIP